MQLIPLPHSVWSALAGRDVIAEADAAAGLGAISRPITLSPLRTMNSLASLVVPLATLLLLALLDKDGWAKVRKVIFVAGIASALLGIAQLALRGSSGLYLYEITNADSAVGLFSNRNHNALFLNIALLFGVFELERAYERKAKGALGLVLVGLAILAVSILLNASRAGLILLALTGLVVVVRLVVRARAVPGKAKSRRGLVVAAAMLGLAALAVMALFAMADSIPALNRLFAQSLDDEQRIETLPTVLALARANMVLGVGFGAFEQAFRAVEPWDWLSPHYLNQAHNDWLQIVIEGGLPGVAIALVAAVLAGAVAVRTWREGRADGRFAAVTDPRWLGLLTLLMIALHSAVDYPLRTPSIMLTAAVAAGLLAYRGPRRTG
ncbi:hypothetical protein AAW00_04640 [Aurantiacibacter luteus]|uniref:O-antigen ligase-related domain-containing protein n=1 Tax=Aurantiacibacter luteus TaxID=1581420 RepID=A0A0G9N2D6_9SPHN|nr:hypothetical protein AAW00_04640 [Aurantiacibacter luteus]